MIVLIPSKEQHEGYSGNLIKVEISDNCPKCARPRSQDVFTGLSYDGSRRLNVDCWNNPCGHIDKYSYIRDGIATGENRIVPFNTPTTRELNNPELA